MKPNCCENGKGGENQQYQQLSNQEWRFFLCWSQGFQRRYLQERLDYQNEDIEVECGCGSQHGKPKPVTLVNTVVVKKTAVNPSSRFPVRNPYITIRPETIPTRLISTCKKV